MIDELKMLLDVLGDISGIAGIVLGSFIAFKLIIYLSTTGAIVFILKLALTNWYNYGVQKKNTVKVYQWAFADDICITSDKTRSIVEQALQKVQESGNSALYIHHQDAKWLLDAVNEKLQKERKDDT